MKPYNRRETTPVLVGDVTIGGNSPIVVQTMANTSTDDIEASVKQLHDLITSGAKIVRFTTQGQREVLALKEIHNRCHEVPLVADVHFQADVADMAAQVVEKVRINPGNYIDPARQFKRVEYSNELERIEERFGHLLDICEQHHTAIRIGVNHGSLSDRIMSRYGNSVAGMVESCMEFLRVAQKRHFQDLIVSLKASNTRLMVEANEVMVRQMDAEGMHYPLHLGVTEAGEGEDGRIKSAVGIGALLANGIGDTIRVSLSEDPREEIPVAKALIDYFVNPTSPRYTQVQVTCEKKRVVYVSTEQGKWEDFVLHSAAECGHLLWENNATELCIKNPYFSTEQLETLSNDILQAARIKMYKTEYISCPSCGRTLFDLPTVVAQIKAATTHLKGLKIAVMGCIVNGPGEMADADYGYVGAGRGRVSLYKGKECVVKNIPSEEAVERLLELIG